MLEISPVLAGTFDAPEYSPVNNYAAGRTDDSATVNATKPIDSRRYTQFDRTATEAGETTDFSFSDLLDTINPLQHIPVVSSVYREMTGEKINPVARVVGDILYGGLLGGATAALSGVSAIGDSVMEASTGKDATGVVVAALFGPDDKKSITETGDTQLASAATDATAVAVLTPAPAAAPVPATGALASAVSLRAASPAAPSPASMPPQPFAKLAGAMPANATPANADAQTQALLAAKAFPLDPKKLPFGGVMDPSSLQGTNMALALAINAPGVQMNQMVRPGQLVNGTKASAISSAPPVAPAAPVVAAAPVVPPATNPPAASPVASDSLSLPPGTAQNTAPLPADLMQDIAALRAVNQYKNAGSQTTPTGSKLDLVN